MTVLNFHMLPDKRIPNGAVYIGRANARWGLRASPFANPFPITAQDDRAAVIEKYRAWLWKQIRQRRLTLDDLRALAGKDLVCYCAPQACHGHVLEKAIAWAVEQPVFAATPFAVQAPSPRPAPPSSTEASGEAQASNRPRRMTR